MSSALYWNAGGGTSWTTEIGWSPGASGVWQLVQTLSSGCVLPPWFSQPAGVCAGSPNHVLSWQAPHAMREGFVFHRSSTWHTVQFFTSAGKTTWT